MAPKSPSTQYYMMPLKKVSSVVVPKNKMPREVVPVQHDDGPPAKRTRFAGLDSDIIMTITQPVDTNRPKEGSHKPKSNPTHSRAKDTSASHSSASISHPTTEVQHAYYAAPTPGQHQLSLQQSSPPWWAWGPTPPLAPGIGTCGL